jgi:glycosyltransferase involved in cell wall biosynthesis
LSSFKVLVKSPFSTYTGYGNDGFGIVRALQKWGCDVYVQPVWVDVPIPKDLVGLFTKALEPPFDLTINHWDPANLNIQEPARRSTRLAVAWTMWEFTSLVPQCRNRSTLKERLKWYDLVLGYSQVTLDALAPWVPKGVATAKLQGGYESSRWHRYERDWFGERFAFGMHGALNHRKQPFTVLQAFRTLKEEHPEEFAGATMAFHTTVPPLFPELNEIMAPFKIRVFYEAWPDEMVREFYKSCHCLVYPSMGEGKNLPCLEMLTTGGTVIATDWSGHSEWLGPHIGYPISDFELKPTFEKYPNGSHHAHVGVDAVKAAMWDVFTHRAEAKRRGDLGAELIPKQCDWDVVTANLFNRIRDNCGAQGELVWNMAQEARRAHAR